MYVLELSEDQYKLLFVLLDRELKSGGLSSLGAVVDLHNLLTSARKKEEAKPQGVEGVKEG